MSQSDFDEIKRIAYSVTGIRLTDQKKSMIYGRLARRVRALGFRNFGQYCQEIENRNSPELHEFTNAITTNLTSFFREIHHFEYLRSKFIPELLKRNARSKRLRIWSAGCSTGEEPYSIAMVLSEFPELRNWDAKILATDLDSNVVERAKSGVYQSDRIEKVPDEYEKNLVNHAGGEAHIRESVAKFITFKQLNLLHEWPMKGPFDAIFCRNVVIYFDAVTQKALFNRYADMLPNDGHLFIGHSESLHNITDRFSLIGRTIYRKAK